MDSASSSALEGRVGQDDAEVVVGLAGKVLAKRGGQGVLVVDIGRVEAVEHEVHGGDAQHGDVEVEAVEHVVLDVFPVGLQEVASVVHVGLAVHLLDKPPLLRSVLLHQVVHGRHQEAAGAAGRVADDVVGLGVHHVHHQLDDMARGAELAVDAGGGELGEQVLVEVSLGVAFGERQLVDHVDRGDQERGLLDHELGVLHELPHGAGPAGNLAQVGEHLVAQQRQHPLARLVLELAPAQSLLVRTEAAFGRLAGAGRLLLFAGLVEVQQAKEHQIRDLLDHGERVGNAALPELQPELVDAAFQFFARHA